MRGPGRGGLTCTPQQQTHKKQRPCQTGSSLEERTQTIFWQLVRPEKTTGTTDDILGANVSERCKMQQVIAASARFSWRDLAAVDQEALRSCCGAFTR